MRDRLAVTVCLVLWLACSAHSSPVGSSGGAGVVAGGAGSGGDDAAGAGAGTTGAAGHHQTDDGLMGTGNGTGAGATAGMLGTWLSGAGQTTRVCPGETGTDAPPEGTLVVGAGRSASEVIVSEPGACDLHFTLAGNVATIVAGQTCSGADGSGGMITFSKMSWTLTLSDDGRTLAESLSADETLAPANGAARTCAFTERDVTLARAR